MATNLVSVVMQFLTPDMIAKIASVLGLDRNVAQKTIAGAIPALLASLADVASTPNGARQLTNTLTQQSGSLESLKNLVGGAGQNLVADNGIEHALWPVRWRNAGYDGSDDRQVRGDRRGHQQVDARHAWPRGSWRVRSAATQHGSRRKRAGVPSHFTEGSDRCGNAVRSRRSVECRRSHRRSDWKLAQRCGGSECGRRPICRGFGADRFTRWSVGLCGDPHDGGVTMAVLVVAAVVLGGLAWFALGRSGEDTVAQVSPPSTTRTAPGTVGLAPTDLTVGGMNLANQINSSVGSIRTVLPGITDAASAEAALPKLKEATAQLNEVSSRATQLSPEGKSTLVKLIVAATPTINQMCDKVLATPGAGDIAKPAIDELRGKLDALARS